MKKTIKQSQPAKRGMIDRSRARRALSNSELRYRRLFETAQDGILILNAATGAIADVNPFLIAMLGYSRDECIGKKLWQVGAFKDIQASRNAFEALQKNEYIRYEDLPLKTKDGRLIQVEFVTNVYLVGDEKVIQCNIRDITDRKHAEEEAGRATGWAEDKFSAVFKHASVPMGVSEIENGRLIDVNDKFIVNAGLRRDQLIGKTPVELGMISTADSSRFAQIMREQGRFENVEVVVQLKDMRERTTLFSAEPITIDGKPRLLTTAIDITDRKRAGETLRLRLAELQALHNVSAAMRNAQTRNQALPILLDETLAALETDAGVIWLYHPEENELRVAVTRGWFRQFEHTALKSGEGIAGQVYATSQPHITPEFATDPVVRQPIGGQFPAGWGGVCLPIRTGAATVGTLTVALLQPRQITLEQVKLLESLTEMAGTTLHRMSMHEEIVRQLERMEASHNIDLAISSSVDLRLTLNILLEHARTLLKADAACVLLLEPYSQSLDYAAARGFRSRSVETTHIHLGQDFAGRVALERAAVRIDDVTHAQNIPQFAALWARENFAAYYGVPLITKGQVKGVLEVYHRAPFHPDPEWISFLETLAGQTAIAVESAQLFENLQRSNVELSLAYDDTIEGWSHALDLRDKETEGHTQRVTEITLRLAKAMGIGEAELVHVRRGALLHDIGKMGVPDSILLKPAGLEQAEWVIMRKHPVFAYELLSPIAYLHAALDIPYCHHEKWDGTGYPRGLTGEGIPLAARIFAIVDVWDALRSDRPYRKAWTEDQVREHVQSLAGTHFDPKVVPAFMRLMEPT